MKRDPLQEQLSAIRAIADQPNSSQALPVLRKALQSKSCFAVSAAAEVLNESSPKELLDLLPPAFDRFMEDPAATDKGCKAKTAIATALYRCEASASDLFRRGLHHVQKEPAWGGSVDTAVELRGVCALGVARLYDPGVLDELAVLLADPEHGARSAAARAIGCTGLREATALLRFKVLTGDKEPQVLTECFASLLQLDSRGTLPFVKKYLVGKDEEKSEAAALALGQSRLDEAFPLLRDFSQGEVGERRRIGLLALAMLRSPAALDHLVSQISAGPAGAGAQAVEALGLHRYDQALRQRVEQAVAAKQNRQLDEAFRKAFSSAT